MSTGNDKFDFILELLETKKLTTVQKERVILLSQKEIKKNGYKEKELEERVRKLEENYEKDSHYISKIKKIEDIILNQGDNQDKGTIIQKKLMPEPNPKHVAEFMSLFNKRDGLKYLTHDIDTNEHFDIDNFLISSEKIFTNFSSRLSIPKSLWQIVKQFAFDSDQPEWTSISSDYSKQIYNKIGWASNELRKWSKQNQLHPIRNTKYESIINDFRRITRIEHPNLEKVINTVVQEVFEEDLVNYEINKSELDKADFYSHVVFLKIALRTIFEEMKKRSNTIEKKKISIKYDRTTSNEYYIRKILLTHHNSFPTKELGLILKEWKEKGNMGKIREKLHGYCHWSVETLIEGSPIRVNILKDKEVPDYEVINETPIGFTHILTFYYK